jgi:TolA-binding protein
MSYKIKTVAKKSVLEPEEIVSRSQVFLDRFYAYRWGVTIAAGLLLVGGLVWAGVAWFQADQNRKGRLLEYQASKEISGVSLSDPNRQAKYEKAVGLYRELLTNYPRSSSAPFAQYQLGNSYFELKRYDEAITAYQDFIQRYTWHETLLPMVYLRLGYAHLLQGDTQTALADFDQVIKHPKAWNKDQAYYESGRVHEQLGDKTAAIGKYESLIKKFPKSSWALEAQTRLKALGVFEQSAPPAGESSPAPVPAPNPNEKK